MVSCPMCDANIDVEEEELDSGDSLTCEECGSSLNVVSTDPLELAEDDDDLDDEDDEDFYDDEDDEDGEDDEEDEDW